MKYLALPLLLSLSLLSCSHPSSPASASTGRLYSLTGEVEEIDLLDSHYDTVVWFPASLDTVRMIGAKTAAVRTGLSGTYYFDSLPAGSYEISANLATYATAYLHVSVPRDTSSANDIHLFPVSWLKATIEKVWPDSDASIGMHVQTRITSTDPRMPSLGSVYLFVDTSRGIDPAVASSYDLVYNIGNPKDSLIDVVLAPGIVHPIYRAGTHVFCTAFASPYAAQFTYASRDTNNMPVYPFFGAHPGNTVEFDIP